MNIYFKIHSGLKSGCVPQQGYHGHKNDAVKIRVTVELGAKNCNNSSSKDLPVERVTPFLSGWVAAMSSLPVELVRACSVGDVETLYLLLNQQPDPGILVNLTSEGDVTLLMHTIIGAGNLGISVQREVAYRPATQS